MTSIDWHDEPPDKPILQALPLIRVKEQPIRGYATIDLPVGVMMHYFRGRSRPHIENGVCEPCREGHQARWKGYITLYSPANKHECILEFTLLAWEGLQAGIRAHGTLLGHEVCFYRTRPRPTAPLKSEVYITTLDLRLLPPKPPIKDILARIWDLDPTTIDNHVARDGEYNRFKPIHNRGEKTP